MITALSLALCSCGKQQDSAAWWAGEQERVELVTRLELENFRFEGIYSGDIAQLDRFHTTVKAADARAGALRLGRDELRDVVSALQHQLVEFKATALLSQRQRAMQKTFDTLYSASGRKFEKVSISTIDDSGVTIRHLHGSARLGFTDLDPAQQQFFGLEADLAKVALEKEAREAVAYEQWVSQRMEMTRRNEAAVAEASPNNRTASLPKQPGSPAPRVVAANVSPLSQPAKTVGSGYGRSYRYSGFRNDRSTYRYIYSNTPSCTDHSTNGFTHVLPQGCPVEYFPKGPRRAYDSHSHHSTTPSDP